MVFSSLVFLFIFFPVTLFFYFIVKNDKAKNIVLVIASLIFYSWGEPVWVCLLIFSSILDYTVSLGIEKYRGKKITKLFIALSVVINLGLLAAFKYSGFFISTLNGIFRLSLHVPAFSLPIGISFYTFQTMSYSLDVYKGDVKAQKSFINFLMFVSLFPQLIAVPDRQIFRHRHADRPQNRYDRRLCKRHDEIHGGSRQKGAHSKLCRFSRRIAARQC